MASQGEHHGTPSPAERVESNRTMTTCFSKVVAMAIKITTFRQAMKKKREKRNNDWKK